MNWRLLPDRVCGCFSPRLTIPRVALGEVLHHEALGTQAAGQLNESLEEDVEEESVCAGISGLGEGDWVWVIDRDRQTDKQSDTPSIRQTDS